MLELVLHKNRNLLYPQHSPTSKSEANSRTMFLLGSLEAWCTISTRYSYLNRKSDSQSVWKYPVVPTRQAQKGSFDIVHCVPFVKVLMTTLTKS